ncbi:MAG: coenzyme F420-0:L-glutamate ligase [Magnetovibrionaceae bacterium]
MAGKRGERLSLEPVDEIGEVRDGDDLAALLCDHLAAHDLKAFDILCIAQKVVSKAEGRLRSLSDIRPGSKALALAERAQKDPRLVELILSESIGVIRVKPGVIIVEHRLGHILANAGIDRSNLEAGSEDMALLLPLDPDGTAENLRGALEARFGIGPLGIIITDSVGRAWRKGTTGQALGVAGLPALLDRRGELDRAGQPLQTTEVCLADQVASAAQLLMGEGAEGRPVVLVSGLDWRQGTENPAKAINRPSKEDLFR